MKVVAAPGVGEFVRGRGGALYVRTDPHRCCSGNVTYLITRAGPERGREYSRYEAEGFEVFFSSGRLDLPDELHLEVRGRRKKRVEAYWNGCVYAI
jgi:hypothetical protein